MDSIIVDRRGHDFCIIDDTVIDTYLPVIGPTAFSVYCVLVRHSNRHKESWPGVHTIAQEVGASDQCIRDSIKILCNPRKERSSLLPPLVQKQARRQPNGGTTSNLYILLPLAKEHHASESVPISNTSRIDGTLFEGDEALRPVRTESTNPVSISSNLTSLVHTLLHRIGELTGGVSNYKAEAGAAKRLLNLSSEPTIDELVQLFESWMKKRDERFGYSLNSFEKSAPTMLVRLRGNSTGDRSPLRDFNEAFDKYVAPGLADPVVR